jgi:phosphatidate cytidylyltransferase
VAEEPVHGRLGVRIASAVALGAGAIAVTVAGGWVFAIAMLAVALVMAWEWLRLVGAPRAWQLYPAVAAVWIAAAGLPAWASLIVLAAAVGGLWLVRSLGRAAAEGGDAWVAAGCAYVGVPLVAILWLRGGPESGAWVVLWLFAVVWATDTGAYVIGRSIGGLRLAPTWSPRKTWAGAIGGLTGGLAVSAVLVDLGMSARPWLVLAAAGYASILSQVGDLMESIVKRRFHRKDSSALIPGHGGVLDRLDSMVVAAPALAIWIALAGEEAWIWRSDGD